MEGDPLRNPTSLASWGYPKGVSLHDFYRHIVQFLDILRRASTHSVRSWTTKDVDNAIRWSRLIGNVVESVRNHPTSHQLVNRVVKHLGLQVSNGEDGNEAEVIDPRSPSVLDHVQLHLLRTLLGNAYVPRELLIHSLASCVDRGLVTAVGKKVVENKKNGRLVRFFLGAVQTSSEQAELLQQKAVVRCACPSIVDLIGRSYVANGAEDRVWMEWFGQKHEELKRRRNIGRSVLATITSMCAEEDLFPTLARIIALSLKGRIDESKDGENVNGEYDRAVDMTKLATRSAVLRIISAALGFNLDLLTTLDPATAATLSYYSMSIFKIYATHVIRAIMYGSYTRSEDESAKNASKKRMRDDGEGDNRDNVVRSSKRRKRMDGVEDVYHRVPYNVVKTIYSQDDAVMRFRILLQTMHVRGRRVLMELGGRMAKTSTWGMRLWRECMHHAL